MEEKSNSIKEPIISVEDKTENTNNEKVLDFKDETLDEDIWESMVSIKLIRF